MVNLPRYAVLGALIACACGGGGGSGPKGHLTVGQAASSDSPYQIQDIVFAKGTTLHLAAFVLGPDGGLHDVGAGVVFASSAPEIATVSGNLLTGVAEGTTVITAETPDAIGTATITVGHGLRAFMTSVTGTGNLSTWADAGGKTGLAAADAVCQARAAAGRLTGTFRALLADSRNHVACRSLGLDGTLGNYCGQGATWHLATPGPWVRMDGLPFLRDPASPDPPFMPLAFDESGAPVHGDAWMNLAALRPDDDCSDWTSSVSGAPRVMEGNFLGPDWSAQRGYACNDQNHLVCLEIGQGAPYELPPREGKKVAFLTSVAGSGNLGSWDDAGGKTGVAAGDAICQARAAAVGLPNAERFKALLSDATTDGLQRVTSDGPWVRVDGVPLAGNKADLATSPLLTALQITETRGVSAVWAAWTGGHDGINNCAGWTDTAGLGSIGSVYYVDGWMDESVRVSCNNEFALYCVED